MSNNTITVSTDIERLNIPYIHQFLVKTYWAGDRTYEEMEIMIKNSSLNFGMYDGGRQIGFARVLTDTLRFAYIMDVFIDEEYQGRGLGQRLMKAVLEHDNMKKVQKVALGTRDAHGVYEKLGFTPLAKPEIWMEKVVPNMAC